MADTIYFYSRSKAYFELSNFSHHPITVDGKVYITNEHYFQSKKFLPGQTVLKENGESVDWQESIRVSHTPAIAKSLGGSRSYSIYPNWNSLRIDVMKTALKAKFTQHPKLKELLLSTGDSTLVEDSPSDKFWGCGKDRTGQNMLGKLLMELREELKVQV